MSGSRQFCLTGVKFHPEWIGWCHLSTCHNPPDHPTPPPLLSNKTVYGQICTWILFFPAPNFKYLSWIINNNFCSTFFGLLRFPQHQPGCSTAGKSLGVSVIQGNGRRAVLLCFFIPAGGKKDEDRWVELAVNICCCCFFLLFQLEESHSSVCRQKDVHVVRLHSFAVALHRCFVFPLFEVSVSLKNNQLVGLENNQRKLKAELFQQQGLLCPSARRLPVSSAAPPAVSAPQDGLQASRCAARLESERPPDLGSEPARVWVKPEQDQTHKLGLQLTSMIFFTSFCASTLLGSSLRTIS